MADFARYETLLATWREKEAHAELIRQFAATGGEHRLRVAVVLADPVLGSVATTAFNDLMEGGGWKTLIANCVKRAERAVEVAKAEVEAEAHASVAMRTSA